MSHDKNGTPIAVGDIVTLECKVIGISPSEDFCNCTLETVEPMFPGDKPSVNSAINAKQVLLVKKA